MDSRRWASGSSAWVSAPHWVTRTWGWNDSSSDGTTAWKARSQPASAVPGGGATFTEEPAAAPSPYSDAGWLRAFHAVVPSLLESFQPQVLVTQCGADTHAEDPLAHLRLSIDGHRTIY